MANPYAKRRTVYLAYATYVQGSWTWQILKLHQSPEKAKTNEYATAYMAVSSPYVTNELGDVYLDSIPRDAKLIDGDDILALTGRR